MTADDEGKVRDLAEKRIRNEITAREAYDEVYRRGLQHDNYHHSTTTGFIMVAGGILCFITFFAGVLHLPFFSDLSQLPTIVFPPAVIYPAIILLMLTVVVMAQTLYLRATKGGSGWKGESETVILVKKGVYSIVRHGAVLSTSAFFTLLTVILSPYVPFNILSVIGNIMVFLSFYYTAVEGDKLNVVKWGDEYRQYMKEVPRYNFVLGLWRWTKRRNKQSSKVDSLSRQS
jgi:protein-S-isoprenylcysteine O-methyltransferase Ste14